jgi:hypothetical protein
MADVDTIALPDATLTQSALYGIVNTIRLHDSVYKAAGSVHGYVVVVGTLTCAIRQPLLHLCHSQFGDIFEAPSDHWHVLFFAYLSGDQQFFCYLFRPLQVALFGRGSLPLPINFEATLPDSTALTLVHQQRARHQCVSGLRLFCHAHTLISQSALGNRKTAARGAQEWACDTARKTRVLGAKKHP